MISLSPVLFGFEVFTFRAQTLVNVIDGFDKRTNALSDLPSASLLMDRTKILDLQEIWRLNSLTQFDLTCFYTLVIT